MLSSDSRMPIGADYKEQRRPKLNEDTSHYVIEMARLSEITVSKREANSAVRV
jgi:hypothetical protein